MLLTKTDSGRCSLEAPPLYFFFNHVNIFRVLCGSLRQHINKWGLYTHLWLSVASFAACRGLWPNALTMPFNYNTVSWGLKYVQHLDCA